MTPATGTPTKIYLHGYLAEKYSKEPITLYVRSVRDAVRGLGSAFGRGFTSDIQADNWHFVKGDALDTSISPVDPTTVISQEEIDFPITYDTLHIYPRIEGAGVIAGLITALGTALGGGTVAGGIVAGTFGGFLVANATNIAVSLIVLAASSAVNAVVSAVNSPSIDYDKAEVDRKASFLYNGVVNVTEQGGPVSLIYGEHMCGSTVISSDILSDQIGIAENEIDIVDSNFWDPSIGTWTGNNCVVSKAGGKLLITKSVAAGNLCFAEVSFVVPSLTRYYVTVEYDAVHTSVVEVNGVTMREYTTLLVEAKDDANLLGTAEAIPKVIYDSAGDTTSRKAVARFSFGTLLLQGTTRLVIYPGLDRPLNDVLTIHSIHIKSDTSNPFGLIL